MSIETEYEFVPCYKGGRCEDAPCCGCGNDYSYLGEYDGYDEYDYPDYEGQDGCDGEADECPFGGCSDCDDPDDVDWTAEDAAMESSLFGDC